MTTITPQDREAAEAYEIGRNPDSGHVKSLAQMFALHRLRTIEECAKIADRHDTGDCTREDMEARRIAAEIRQLGEEA